MRLLVGVRNVEDAMACASVAHHIAAVHVKDPAEGALGASYPWVISAVRETMPPGTKVSASLGDTAYKPRTMAQAAFGATVAGAQWVTVGLLGASTVQQAIELMRAVVRAAKSHDPDVVVGAAGYADAHRVGSVSPLSLPHIAYESGADLTILDTAIKDGSSLLDHVSLELCGALVAGSHRCGLLAAVDGASHARQVRDLVAIGTDILCVDDSVRARDSGALDLELIASLTATIGLTKEEAAR